MLLHPPHATASNASAKLITLASPSPLAALPAISAPLSTLSSLQPRNAARASRGNTPSTATTPFGSTAASPGAEAASRR